MFGIKTRKQLMAQYEPMADYGFLGPDSVSWKVWGHPTSYVLGFVRAVTIEHFDPNLAAAVIQSGGVKYRPATRYGRTLRYFGLQLFGGAEQTCKAADVLVKVHSKAIGHDPVTGGTYDANDGGSQLWIHVTAWHSILKCYEMFGPGKLTEDEENRFWAEMREVAKLQTIDPDLVPTSREAVHQYFEDWRPRLAASEGAQDMIRFILPIDVALPVDAAAWQKAALKPAIFLMTKAVIATYPQYMRDMAGIRQSRLTDALVRLPVKAMHSFLNSNLYVRMLFMSFIAPQAVPVAAPAILGIKPVSEKVWEVREAQQHFGFDIPAEAHKDMRARQYERVFEKGEKPSDEGLEESQAHIGSLDVLHPEVLGA
ncbi:MAG TPA: oxygenase MpaB family protein [Nocardioides sp.]|nr:oxygenase MpaB family protein [Nocardioides sp.]